MVGEAGAWPVLGMELTVPLLAVGLLGLLKWRSNTSLLQQNLRQLMKVDGGEVVKVTWAPPQDARALLVDVGADHVVARGSGHNPVHTQCTCSEQAECAGTLVQEAAGQLAVFCGQSPGFHFLLSWVLCSAGPSWVASGSPTFTDVGWIALVSSPGGC